MTTYAQHQKYGAVGNEKLLQLAAEGDAAAHAVLGDRGNTVTADGKLRKLETKAFTVRGKEFTTTRLIENGKVIEQDGVPVTGNISPF